MQNAIIHILAIIIITASVKLNDIAVISYAEFLCVCEYFFFCCYLRLCLLLRLVGDNDLLDDSKLSLINLHLQHSANMAQKSLQTLQVQVKSN